MAQQRREKLEQAMSSQLLKTMADLEAAARPKLNPVSEMLAQNRRKQYCPDMPIEEQLTRQGQYYEVGWLVGR